MHFKLRKDKSGEWRWSLVASNGKTIADSGEGYVDKADALHGIELVRGAGVGTPILE